MKMKKILRRKNGRPIEDISEARALVNKVKSLWPMVQSDDHRAPIGYSSALIAERANLRAIKEAHRGYISIYQGAEYCGLEGYKALFIGFKELPSDFEKHFPDYVVIG